MKLDINELRVRAAKFSMNWNDAKNENRETQSFYNDFFEIFNVTRRDVAEFEEAIQITKKRRGYIDLFWPKVLIVEQKSAGKNLTEAEEQADRYYGALPVKKRPRYRLVCDFQNFRLFDYTKPDEEDIRFTLAELKENIKHFEFISDITFESYKKQESVSIKASERVGWIHDTLDTSKYAGEDLEIFLTRLVFCMFADNTGIFEPHLFQKLIYNTDEDGSETGGRIAEIFQILDTPEDKRQTTLDKHITKLPYVNGGLFKKTIPIATFDKDMRLLLLNATTSDWSDISPAIFGSMFQSVIKKEDRRKQGAHYTNERNILKLIDSLFMDDLLHEFEQIRKHKITKEQNKLLKNFQDKLAKLTFFDPACGSGNILLITYRELRRLEIKVLKLLHQKGIGGEQIELDAQDLSKIDVHQFYGIELNDFAVHITRSALWMMDHFMNREMNEALGQVFLRIPLKKTPTIKKGDALEMDWEKVLPAKNCNYIIGNPPFVGAKTQSQYQREQVRDIANLGGSGGTLDYVCAWYIKAGHYIQGKTGIGLFATNSITQGQQVAQLWPTLFEQCNLDIIFAHQSFEWESEAPGSANVHVVIIGLEKQEYARKNRRLFSYEYLKGQPIGKSVLAISPYLFGTNGIGSPRVVIKEETRPLNGFSKMVIGTKPIDGGHYILNEKEKKDLLSEEPGAFPYIHPYIGASEFLKGTHRYIINAPAILDSEFKKLPLIKKIRTQVKKYRLGKIPRKGKPLDSIKPPGMSSLKLAETPAAFHVTSIPKSPFLVIPETSSEKRAYIPIAMFAPPVIPSNAIRYIKDSTPADFALLTSAMHMAWMRTVAGRLKSDYRYSIGMVYNTFPVPKGKDLSKLETYGQAILDARLDALKKDPKATLADLYDRDGMQPNLRRAHEANDRAVDRLYSPKPFADDTARINHLFALYEKQTTQSNRADAG